MNPNPQSTAPVVQVDVHLGPEDRLAALRRDVMAGLTSRPKQLPPKWFYDERGSALFAEITRLPEYYLTGSEREILSGQAGEIAEVAHADTLVELGSGTSEKTRFLLDALAGAGTLRRFVAFDVSEATLRESAARIADEYPGIEVHAVVGDFDEHLHLVPRSGRRLVAFLGSSIGNLAPQPRAAFLADLRSGLGPDDSFLLGTDLVKDIGRLEAAYNDPAGITAAFNRNMLQVLNRELGADFDPDSFDHAARWEPVNEWIEMLLVSRIDQTVFVAALELGVEFRRGEELRTEISAKFRREGVERELRDAGFRVRRWWTDRRDEFALSLSVPA